MISGQKLASLAIARRLLSAGLIATVTLSAMRPGDAQEWSHEPLSVDLPATTDDAYVEDIPYIEYNGYHDSVTSMPASEWDSQAGAACHCQSAAKAKCPGVCLDPGFPAKPKRQLPGDIDEGDCPSIRYRMDDRIRSGDPNCVYKWAQPSITKKYSAWYVGGGAVFKGRGRTAAEGTWGLDYDGLFGHARTWLNYTCGKRQGGEGAYEGEHVPLKKKLSAHH